jgi:hypothetical protein
LAILLVWGDKVWNEQYQLSISGPVLQDRSETIGKTKALVCRAFVFAPVEPRAPKRH